MVAYLTHQGKTIRDADWAAKMFMVSADQIQDKYRFAAYSTSAHNKFTDTRPGGNWAMNNPPAYTRNADPRQNSILHKGAGPNESTGMGNYYSRQIDDNAHLTHWCFGVSNFRGMFSFFSGMGDLKAAMYARLGRVPIGFLLGKVAGIYASLRLLPLVLVGVAAKFLLNRGSSKYYSLKPTMHAYWKRVDFIANTFATNIGLYQTPAWLQWGQKEQEAQLDPTGSKQLGYTQQEQQALVKMAHQAAPELFKERGGIDVYEVATRTQRLASQRRKLLEDNADKINSGASIMDLMLRFEYKLGVKLPKKESLEELLTKSHNKTYSENGENLSVGGEGFNEETFDTNSMGKDYLENSVEGQLANTAQLHNESGEAAPGGAKRKSDLVEGYRSAYNGWVQGSTGFGQEDFVPERAEGWMSKLWRLMSDNYHGAYMWVTFNVQHSGSVSSSFSNSSKEADISSMVNGFTSSMANARFTFSNGATGLPVFDGAMKTIKDVAMGFADGLGVGGLINLAGSSYMDVPEHWDSSSTTWPSESFKMSLRSVYANKLSRFLAMYIPLSMVLAGALPISTGRQQYASPYYCQVISPGRMTTKLGMIDSLNIEVGVGNLGFNQQNQPLGFDVSWSVKDMNKVMHAPIDIGGGFLNPARGIFDDDNAFNDYLNVITGLSMVDQITPIRKLSKNIAIRLQAWDSFWSLGYQSMGFYDSMLGRGVKTAVTIAGMSGVPGTIVPQLNRSLAK